MRFLKNKRGQVVVEYILLIAALVSIIGPLMRLITSRLSEDCPSPSVLCTFQRVYTGDGMFGGSFRYFTLRGAKNK